jgi:glycosyltransferase involved in cell wall biosynthesis
MRFSRKPGLDLDQTMQPLRIVLVMVEPPLPFGNAMGRWFYVLLKGLVERGHNVAAFATCNHPEEIEQAQKLFPAPAYNLRCYGHPVRSGLKAKWETLREPYSYMFSPELRRDLAAQMQRGFDILQLEQLWGGWLAPANCRRALLNVSYLPTLDLAGDHPRSGSWTARQLALRGERKLLRRFSRISTLTPRLTEQVRTVNPRASIHTVPLGMDLALYKFPDPVRREGPPMVSLIGSFDWLPTMAAGIRILTRLWPAIQRAYPEARLQLVGRNVRRVLQHVGREELSGVVLVENVPDILPCFRKTDVLLYPADHASGMKVKVMESFALGVPVVTTSFGVEGLPAIDCVHAGIAEDDEGLIARTISLLRNEAARASQSVAARDLIATHCSPARTLGLLEDVYAQMASADS